MQATHPTQATKHTIQHTWSFLPDTDDVYVYVARLTDDDVLEELCIILEDDLREHSATICDVTNDARGLLRYLIWSYHGLCDYPIEWGDEDI